MVKITIFDKYLRFEGETFDDYAIRLYSSKDIYSLTNAEIGNLLNKESDLNYDESAYRKKYTNYIEGFRKGLESQLEITDSENKAQQIIKDMHLLREENFKSEIRLRDKLRELRSYKRVEARSENLKHVLFEKIDELHKFQPELHLDREEITGDRIAVVQFSDWHYGEVVEDGLNKYNKEIFEVRLSNVTRDIIKYGKLNQVNTLKILNLGDLISGNIRISARVMNEEDVITQSIEVAEYMRVALLELSKYFNIEYYSVLDNHSRVSPNYNAHIERESFARLISWHLEATLKDNDRISIRSNKINEIVDYDIGVINIFDKKALFTHGHNDKLRSVISDISMLTGIKPISVFMGHLHRNIEDEEFNIDLIVNPSLIGLGAYSKTIRKSSKPRQKMNVYAKEGEKVYRESMYFLQGE